MEATNQVQEQVKAEVSKAQIEQKDAVFNLALSAVNATLKQSTPTPTGKAFKELITKEVRKAIRVGLYDGIKNGDIKYSKAGKSDGQLKKYCSSLINNWLKKDPRFNT